MWHEWERREMRTEFRLDDLKNVLEDAGMNDRIILNKIFEKLVNDWTHLSPRRTNRWLFRTCNVIMKFVWVIRGRGIW
jgi:hypothetical protein